MQQVEANNRPAAGAARGPWWSSRRGQTALRAIAGCLIELLPVEAVLIVVAAADGNPPDQAAAPFWYLCAVIAAAWLLGYRLRQRSNQSIVLASAVPFLALYLLLLQISPATTGMQPATALLLFLLVFYLWLRGTSLAIHQDTPASVIRRFAIYLCVLLLAIAGLNAVPPEIRTPDAAALTLLLIGQVFFALVSAALAQLAAQRRLRNDWERDDEARWVGSALLVALSVVGVALLASLIVGYQSFLALLGYFGPAGIALGNAIIWVLTILGMLAAGILSLVHLTPPAKKAGIQQQSNAQYGCLQKRVNGKTVLDCALRTSHGTSALVTIVEIAIIVLLLALLVIVLVLIARRALTRYRQSERLENGDEREALDGRALFAAQMRGLLDRLRRPAAPGPDPLQRGSVRYMYRDVLRSAQSRGLERTPAETPDDYARRLARFAPLATSGNATPDDLLALSEAYNGARYADREPEASDRAALQERTGRLTKLFGG